METTNNDNSNGDTSKSFYTPDRTGIDTNADKTGTDKNADKTENINTNKANGPDKFDKPKREPNPDKTGIDTNADKTQK